MRSLLGLLSAGLLLAQVLPDSVYIRLKEQGINPANPAPLPPGFPLPLDRPESDCPGARRVCGAVYDYPVSVETRGQIQDIPSSVTCLMRGENRTAWFIFTVQSSGTMGFYLCPYGTGTSGRDYDFALWDVTGLDNPCDVLRGSDLTGRLVRCNYSGNQSFSSCCQGISCPNGALTGLDHTNPRPLYPTISHDAGQSPIMPGLQVNAGQTFLLLVDNFSSNNTGFLLTFTGTAEYFDNQPPRMESVFRSCGSSYDHQQEALYRIRVRFNELIRPNSVATDGSDFTLFDDATNTQIPIISAAPLNPNQTNSVELVLGQPLTPGRVYRLYVNYNDPAVPGGPSGGSNRNPIQDQCGVYLDTLNIPPGSAADSFYFSILDTMIIQITTLSPACTGTNTGQISVRVTGGLPPYQYVLVPGNSAIPPTSGWSTNDTWTSRGAGTYTVWVRDSLRCIQRRVITLQDPPPLSLVLLDSLLLTCGGQRIAFVLLQGQGGTPPYEYSLLPTAPVWTSNPYFGNLDTGTYTLRIRDSAGCIATRSVSLTLGALVAIQSVQYDILGECPDPRTVRAQVQVEGIPPLTYVWEWNDEKRDSTTVPMIERAFSPAHGGKVSLKVRALSGDGCTDERSVEFTLVACTGLSIPSAFTPNGDGINDQWVIRAPGFQRYTIVVYDRWGREVWNNEGDMTKLWDGRVLTTSQEVPEGVYTYIFRGVDKNGAEVMRTGTVTVLR